MLFPEPPRTANDIRSFCNLFTEGIRVEYKSRFDENVRRTLPKIVSSFANSLGGVLIIGVTARDGVPVEPIEGFAAQREEMPLTVENLCILGTNPPVFPRTTVIDSDLADRKFLVIEVDQSWEAPHAIENSRKVYVRTGNSTNPYDLADVDSIVDLIRRREQPIALRDKFLSAARERADLAVASNTIYTDVSITPLYPKQHLCTREETWQFLSGQRYLGGLFFRFESLRRVEDGTASFRMREQYGQLNASGVLFERKAMRPQRGLLLSGDPLHALHRLLIAGARFYSAFGYKGDVEVSLSLSNVLNQRLVFIPNVEVDILGEDDYRNYERFVYGQQIVPAPSLSKNLVDTVISILEQIFWPFWQSNAAFPKDVFREYTETKLRELGHH